MTNLLAVWCTRACSVFGRRRRQRCAHLSQPFSFLQDRPFHVCTPPFAFFGRSLTLPARRISVIGFGFSLVKQHTTWIRRALTKGSGDRRSRMHYQAVYLNENMDRSSWFQEITTNAYWAWTTLHTDLCEEGINSRFARVWTRFRNDGPSWKISRARISHQYKHRLVVRRMNVRFWRIVLFHCNGLRVPLWQFHGDSGILVNLSSPFSARLDTGPYICIWWCARWWGKTQFLQPVTRWSRRVGQKERLHLSLYGEQKEVCAALRHSSVAQRQLHEHCSVHPY